MTDIHIDLQRLKAVQLLAAKNDVRPYMNGVCVEATKTETRLIATQGHIAGFMRHCNPPNMFNEVNNDDYVEFILPNEVIDKVKLSKYVSNIGTVLIEETRKLKEVEGDTEYQFERAYTLRLWDGTLMPFQPCTDKYPDMRRVFPAQVSGEAANFNPNYLATFRKVATALDVSKYIGGVWIQFNGEGASRVILAGQADFAGLIMPVRDQGEVKNFEPLTFPVRGPEQVQDDDEAPASEQAEAA